MFKSLKQNRLWQVLNGNQVDRVTFYQHEGWYTRNPGRYEVFESTHPVAYVGKLRQGTYHDDGGSGTCCYFEDYRNPGSTRAVWFEQRTIYKEENTKKKWT